MVLCFFQLSTIHVSFEYSSYPLHPLVHFLLRSLELEFQVCDVQLHVRVPLVELLQLTLHLIKRSLNIN